MNSAGPVPVFKHNFDQFLNYLQDIETGAPGSLKVQPVLERA